ncbi:MAG TPA: nitronate monooxygenase [Candidatus Krumholzibacterium sp.]|nr:nitronate monooxygenase [Candidatus Krumholzibacterium sp.]
MSMINMPPLKIDNLTVAIPVIQGGMAVGVSLSGLAGSVAREGGIGVIATAGIGRLEPDFTKDVPKANQIALTKEIQKAKKASGGLIGVNIMLALTDHEELLLTAEHAGADIAFLSAGLPLGRPCGVSVEELRNFRIKIFPKVSSARATKLIFKYWDKNYQHVPDGVVVEGPMAGGHLGFRTDDIDSPAFKLEELVPAVVDEIIPYREKYAKDIPVIAAGGIYTGEDIFEALHTLRASGVTMGTRFVATDECDAQPEFKQAYIDCSKEDLKIIASPVGLPGRAIWNAFLADVSQGMTKPYSCLYHCIKSCDVKNAPYCIGIALSDAARGFMQKGLTFAGANAWRVDKIMSVKNLLEELKAGFSKAAMVGAGVR